MKKTIIAITGNKGAGKDTLAKILKENLEGQVNLFSFAFFLKSIAKYLTGLDLEEIEYFKRKEDLKIIGKKDVREFLIYLSQLVKELTKESIFVDKVIKEIDMLNPDYAIITDMRFMVEYEKLKNYAENNNYKFFVILVQNTQVIKDYELEVGLIPYDYLVINHKDKGIEYLKSMAFKIIDYMKGRKDE